MCLIRAKSACMGYFKATVIEFVTATRFWRHNDITLRFHLDRRIMASKSWHLINFFSAPSRTYLHINYRINPCLIPVTKNTTWFAGRVNSSSTWAKDRFVAGTVSSTMLFIYHQLTSSPVLAGVLIKFRTKPVHKLSFANNRDLLLYVASVRYSLFASQIFGRGIKGCNDGLLSKRYFSLKVTEEPQANCVSNERARNCFSKCSARFNFMLI